MGSRVTRRSAIVFAAAAPAILLRGARAAPSVDIATYRGAGREALILEGARREGKVVFYSGMIENQALRPMADAFRKKYPFMSVDYYRGDSRALVLKALTEQRARRIVGDIIESTGGAEALTKAGAVRPFSSPSAAAFPASYADPGNMWVASRLDYFGMAYNTRQVSAAEVPKTYEALLDPKWKDAISWRADSEVGAPLFIASMLRSMGKEKGEDYLRRLSAQRVVNYAGSARALVDRVGEGEYKLALFIYAHHPLISQAKGAPLDTQMLEPVPSTVSTIQLARNAPHPYAAMLFIDFMLSVEGQSVLRKIVPRLANLKELVLTPEIMFESRDEANALFDKYFR